MKILHIIDSGGLYGAEMVLLNLVEEQMKLGLKPVIASIGEKGIREKPFEKAALERNVKIKKFRMRPGPNYLGAFKILRYAHQENFNVMHSHGYKGNILFGLIPKVARKLPIVTTLHGWTSTNSLTRMRVYEWLDAFSIKYVDAVVLVNRGMLSNQRARKWRGIHLHIIDNGIPVPFITRQSQISALADASARQQLLDQGITEFCKRGYTIGAIGRLSREKGYVHLIKAFNTLIKKGFDLQLLIIGDGDERDTLEQLSEKFDLRKRIMLPGYRDRAKDYLSYLKVLVIPSLTEGLPITLLEAMHAKIPIIATKVGGIPYVLENGRSGLLIPPCDSDALASAISYVYHNKELAAGMTNMAHKKALAHYTSEKMALGYLDVYRRVCRWDQEGPTHSAQGKTAGFRNVCHD